MKKVLGMLILSIGFISMVGCSSSEPEKTVIPPNNEKIQTYVDTNPQPAENPKP